MEALQSTIGSLSLSLQKGRKRRGENLLARLGWMSLSVVNHTVFFNDWLLLSWLIHRPGPFTKFYKFLVTFYRPQKHSDALLGHRCTTAESQEHKKHVLLLFPKMFLHLSWGKMWVFLIELLCTRLSALIKGSSSGPATQEAETWKCPSH